MTEQPVLLLVDPDRASQKLIAAAFNKAGTMMRFIREATKTAQGVRTLKPALVLVQGDLPFLGGYPEYAAAVVAACLPDSRT